ncbi:MAG: malonyl-CoA decarboxylase [Rhodospirillales bacterium]|nr:malonyl-CoA decarboxylase [Rhodospirillales bacterium]
MPAASSVAALPPPAAPGFLDRALRRISAAWREMAASVAGEAAPDLATRMQACLDGRGGEVSSRARAAGLAETYQQGDAAARAEFLRVLAGFDADPAAIEAAIAARNAAPPAARGPANAALRQALEPPRRRLLQQFTTIPDGVKFLVDLRADLLARRREDGAFAALEGDLRELLASWFDIGFLDLHRIDWSSPAALLEKLVGYEAVHEIRSWRDLKNRLDSDRRCYAFFHPRMPHEPLIFVEVALVRGIAGSVQRLLDEKAPVEDPRAVDTAIFYSISNCQKGLAGISFGNFLIKRVVALLAAEFPNLKHFATLSPMPGFRAWLDREIAGNERLLAPAEAEALAGRLPDVEPRAALARLLGQRGWQRDAALSALLEPVLLRLGARYLLEGVRGKDGKGGRALDPVAHFHLSNGAAVERLNMLADISDKGVKESATLMVNYLYDPARIEANHEAYVGAGERRAATAVRRLARGWS